MAGAGLTMADLIVALNNKGHHGPVVVLSRHGRLPMPHTPITGRSWEFTDLPSPPYTVIELFRYIRSQVERARAMGVELQEVFNALRPHGQAWWRGMSYLERSRFLRHVRNLWDIHRHRIPPQIHQLLHQLIDAGRLQLIAGHITEVKALGERLNVSWRSHGVTDHAAFDHVVNCTGPQHDSCRLNQPLLRDLLEQGLATCDPLGIGLQLSAEGQLIGTDGKLTAGLYAIGPMRKAMLWETTAVKEISEQAVSLADRLVGELAARTIA